MQHVNRIREFNSVDRAVSVAVKILHNFQNTGSCEALQRLGAIQLRARLRESKRKPHASLNRARQFLHFLKRPPYPVKRFMGQRQQVFHSIIMPKMVI